MMEVLGRMSPMELKVNFIDEKSYLSNASQIVGEKKK